MCSKPSDPVPARTKTPLVSLGDLAFLTRRGDRGARTCRSRGRCSFCFIMPRARAAFLIHIQDDARDLSPFWHHFAGVTDLAVAHRTQLMSLTCQEPVDVLPRSR